MSDPHPQLAPGSIVTERSGTAREVLSLSLPLVLSFLSFTLMSVVDAFIMGRVGTPEQGATALGALLAWVTAVVFTATFTVVNTFVAQDFGAGLLHRLRTHVNTAFWLIPLFTVAVWALIPALPSAIRAMGTDAAVAPFVVDYARVRLLGVPFLYLIFTVTSYLRGQGEMWTPLVVTVAANLVNAALTVVLVFGLGPFEPLGVRGAAWGSVVSAGLEAGALLAVYFGERHHRLYATRSLTLPSIPDLRRFLVVGLPIGLAWAFDNVAWAAFSVFASTLDPASLAANMIMLQLMQFSFLPAAAVSVVGTTLVGQYLGARRPDLAMRAGRLTVLIGVAYMAAMGAVFALLREPLVAAFNPDPAVVSIGVRIVMFVAIFQPLDGLGITIVGVLRGAGDTRYPMFVLFGCAALVFLPGVWLLGHHLGLGIIGAWAAALVHVFAVAVGQTVRFLRGRWADAAPDDPA